MTKMVKLDILIWVVVFIKIDVDELEDLAGEYEVEELPTFILFKNGTKVETFKGYNEDSMKKAIAAHNS